MSVREILSMSHNLFYLIKIMNIDKVKVIVTKQNTQQNDNNKDVTTLFQIF